MRVLHMLARGGVGGIESLCVDIAKHSGDDNSFYFLWGGGKNAEKIADMGRKTYVRSFKYKNVSGEYIQFKKTCITNSIDCLIVHGLSPMMLIFAARIKKQCPGIKLVIYLHANAVDYFRGIKGLRKRLLFQRVYRLTDGCIAISEAVRKSFEKCCDCKKINVIYNAVDMDRFRFSENKEQSIPTLIYVGRLVPVKGVDLLIKAAAEMSEQVHIIIVGEGTSRGYLENLAADLAVDAQFVGTQTNVPDWIGRADIFVHPAIWEEGFGITLIEAMAAGLPCIAFRKGAIPEIITDGVDGFIVDEVSYKSLADEIIKCITILKNEPQNWQKLCKNAYDTAHKYDVKKYVGELSEYIAR